MTPDATHLTGCNLAPPIIHVRITNDTPLHVISIGYLTTHSFSGPHVSHVPNLSMHLKSVSQLTDFNCHVVFDHTSYRV